MYACCTEKAMIFTLGGLLLKKIKIKFFFTKIYNVALNTMMQSAQKLLCMTLRIRKFARILDIATSAYH